MNSLSSQEVLSEISAVDVGSINMVGSTFVIPIEAALPAELEQLEFSTGTLYERLAALNALPAEQDFGIVIISGQELVDIAQSWTALTEVKKVYVLLDLPGVRYNTLFILGYKQAGIATISWTSVSAGLSERVRTRQQRCSSHGSFPHQVWLTLETVDWLAEVSA